MPFICCPNFPSVSPHSISLSLSLTGAQASDNYLHTELAFSLACALSGPVHTVGHYLLPLETPHVAVSYENYQCSFLLPLLHLPFLSTPFTLSSFSPTPPVVISFFLPLILPSSPLPHSLAPCAQEPQGFWSLQNSGPLFTPLPGFHKQMSPF